MFQIQFLDATNTWRGIGEGSMHPTREAAEQHIHDHLSGRVGPYRVTPAPTTAQRVRAETKALFTP